LIRDDVSTAATASSSPREGAPVDDGPKITFNFKETEPDTRTFTSRLMHFMNVTYTPLWFVPDAEIEEGVSTVKEYKQLAAQSPNGDL